MVRRPSSVSQSAVAVISDAVPGASLHDTRTRSVGRGLRGRLDCVNVRDWPASVGIDAKAALASAGRWSVFMRSTVGNRSEEAAETSGSGCCVGTATGTVSLVGVMTSKVGNGSGAAAETYGSEPEVSIELWFLMVGWTMPRNPNDPARRGLVAALAERGVTTSPRQLESLSQRGLGPVVSGPDTPTPDVVAHYAVVIPVAGQGRKGWQTTIAAAVRGAPYIGAAALRAAMMTMLDGTESMPEGCGDDELDVQADRRSNAVLAVDRRNLTPTGTTRLAFDVLDFAGNSTRSHDEAPEHGRYDVVSGFVVSGLTGERLSGESTEHVARAMPTLSPHADPSKVRDYQRALESQAYPWSLMRESAQRGDLTEILNLARVWLLILPMILPGYYPNSDYDLSCERIALIGALCDYARPAGKRVAAVVLEVLTTTGMVGV